MRERLTAIAASEARENGEDKALRNLAVNAIGGNLADLRKAMGKQRQYDRTTVKRVADLARILLTNGYLDDMTRGEVKRLVSAVKNSTGVEDVTGSVEKVMDIMVKNMLRRSEDAFEKARKVKAAKVDAKGVVVQGKLDVKGQQMVKALNDGLHMNSEDLYERIADCEDRMGSDDEIKRSNAATEYEGLLIARQYHDEILASEAEERELGNAKDEAKENLDKGLLTKEAYRELVAEIDRGIAEKRMRRIEAFGRLTEAVGGRVGESVLRAKEFKEAEKERVEKIHHFANSDMQGREQRIGDKDTKQQRRRNMLANTLLSPFGTMETVMRALGDKAVDGAGYLFNHFVRGAVGCRDTETRAMRTNVERINARIKELFGEKTNNWKSLVRNISGKELMETTVVVNGKEVTHTLTHGNGLYIYMVNKMQDGKVKLRAMGITEEDVARISDLLDPRLVEFADWVQGELLPELRERYNEVYEKMFGAPMSAIDDYFPIRILGSALDAKTEVKNEETAAGRVSTVTGSVKKRVFNTKPINIFDTDAIVTTIEHLEEMEHFAAWAEWNKDANTLLNYKRFKNQVKGMSTLTLGGGNELWDKLVSAVQITAGEYRSGTNKVDEAAIAISSGATAAAIAGRTWTAMKQLLSEPAFWADADFKEIAKALATPKDSWNWALRELPTFLERWESRIAGDNRLEEFGGWQSGYERMQEYIRKYGMFPNAFVDALTVATGAKAVYETSLNKYKKLGMDEAQAKQRALEDAAISFNSSQQSSEGLFLSRVQKDRTVWNVMFTMPNCAMRLRTRSAILKRC